jgi:hypothetical protein
MGPDRNHGDKFWWWREAYSGHEEPVPDLSIAALRLDAPAPPVSIERATHARIQGGRDLMLTFMEFPTEGCWEVRGTYQGSQKLTVVVFVRSRDV